VKESGPADGRARVSEHTPGEPLVGDVDLKVALSYIPPDNVVKGLFFTRWVAALGEEWEQVLPQLDAPAKHGRYHAFEAYPMRDYLRLVDRVARSRMPGATREGYRVLSRGEVEVFAASTLGKVTFSLIRDPGAALVRYADFHTLFAPGALTRARREDDRRVVISHSRYRGTWEQGLGICEALVLAFDQQPRVTVTVEMDRRVSFDIRW